MEIEDLPRKLGLKRSIAVLAILMMLGGVSLGIGIGTEITNNQVEERLLSISGSGQIAKAGGYYYNIIRIEKPYEYDMNISNHSNRPRFAFTECWDK